MGKRKMGRSKDKIDNKGFLERLSGHCWICVDILIIIGCMTVTRIAFKMGDDVSLLDYAGAYTIILGGGKIGQGAKNFLDRKGR